MEKFKHKYIFYFFKKLDIAETWTYKPSFFRFFGRVKDGKEFAKALDREYDYQKIF